MSTTSVNMIFYTQLRFRKITLFAYAFFIVVLYFSGFYRHWGQLTALFNLVSYAVLAYGIIALIVNRYKVVYSICLIVLPGSFTFLPNIQQTVFSILYRLF